MSFIESYYKNTSFDDLKAGIAVYNPKDMSIDTLNDTFATIHGYDVDELIGMPVENLFISKHMHLFQVKEKKFEVSMEDSVYETLHRKKDGSTFSVFVQITAIKDENGNIKQKILNVTDISRYKKARQELKKHKLEYRALSENIPDAVVRYDMDIRRVYVNKEWERINGISSDEAIGKTPIELSGVISHQAKEFHKKLKNVVKHEKSDEWDFEFLNLYGNVNCYSVRAVPEYNELGKVTGILTTARDITQRKELEEEKISEQMRSYFESQLVGMAITSPQKKWLRVNKKLSSMLGYTYSELKSMTWEEITHPDDLNGEVEEYTKMLNGEIDEYIYEKRFIHKNGTMLFAKLLVSCVRNNDQSVDYVLTLIEDITGSVCSQDAQFDLNSTLEERIKNRTNELQRVHSKLDMEVAGRKHVQRQLTSREQLFTSVMENLPGFVFKYRLMPDGKEEFLYASKGIYDVYGVTSETALNNISVVREVIHPEDIKSFRDAIEESARALEVFDVEFRVLHHEKGELWLKSRSTPQKQDDGSIIWHGITIDITKRKEAEELLKKREFEFHSLAENLPYNIARFDTEGRYLYINPTHERLLGMTLSEAIGTFIPESHTKVKAAIAQAVATKEKVTIQQKVSGESGEIEIHDISITPEFGENKDVVSVLGIGRDITEAKRKEIEYRTLTENSPDVIVRYDCNLKRVYVNKAWEHVNNATRDDVIGKSLTERLWVISKVLSSYEQFLKSIIKTGETANTEFSIVDKNSKTIYFNLKGVPEFDSDGKAIGVLTFARDITERKEMEELLRKKELEFRTIMENTADTVARYDKECVRTYANPSFAKMAGKSVDELLGKTPTYYFDTPQGKEYEKAIQRVYSSGVKEEFEFSWKGAEGSVITSLISLVPESDNTGVIQNVLATGRDITKLKEFENEIKKQNNFHESLLEGIANIGLTLSVLEEGRFIYTNNHKAAKEYGYDPEKLSETRPSLLTTIHPQDREKVMQMYEKRLRGEDVPNRYTVKVVKSGGDIREEELSVVLVPNTNPVQTVIVTKDVTQKLENERKVEFLAHHDVLTGLPNRTQIKEKVYRSLEEANKKREQVAILFIDLDGFKAVNDSLGHSAGDDMLKMVASRLKECIDTKDIISRQGGDEFLVVLPDIQDINDVVKSADKLVNAFTRPFTLRNQVISTSASIGIALYPDHGNDFEQLLQCSDAAMYKAKEAGKNSFCFFTQRMKNEILVQFQMQNDLKDAVKNKEFILHYQPQVDIKENKIIGAEALLRWEHPKHGMIPPNSFIPIAESSSLIVEIGEWVIMEACRQAAIWNAQGKDITVAVNISAVQFKKGNLEDVVKRALYLSGLEPRYLELELTESILINNTESVLQTVKVIKELEIQLSIDDFGTGYSSLSYLKRFAVDKLKIDQSFVRDIINDNENASIVRTIIQMAKSFNLSSIAEGVEDENVLALVKEFGCDEVQGYHFAKPMIVDDFEDYYMSFNK